MRTTWLCLGCALVGLLAGGAAPLAAQDQQGAAVPSATTSARLLVDRTHTVVTAGATFDVPPVVRVLGADGQPIAGVVVRAVAGATTRTLGTDLGLRNSQAITDTSGSAEFRNLIILGEPRILQIGFSFADGSPVAAGQVEVRAPVPERIRIVSRVPWHYRIGEPIGQAPKVLVVSSTGEGIPGIPVDIVSGSGSASLSGSQAVTNARGEAEFPAFLLEVDCTADGCPPQRLVFQAGPVQSDTMLVEPIGAVPARATFTSSPSTITVDAVSTPFEVEVKGSDRLKQSAVPGATVELRADGYGVLGEGKTDRNGIARISPKNWLPRVGRTEVFAVANGKLLDSVAVNVVAGGPSRMRILHQPPRQLVVDSAFATNTVITVSDRAGNPIKDVQVWAVLCGRGRPKKRDSVWTLQPEHDCPNPRLFSELAGTLTRATNDKGEAEFDDLTFRGRAGQYRVIFIADEVQGDTVSVGSSILDHNPDVTFDHSYVSISAIKSIAGAIPDDEFFDLRFRFRLGSSFHVLASTDIALSARNTDSVSSRQKVLTEGGVLANYELHHRRDPVTDVPERTLYTGAQLKVFNTIPYYGIHVGSVELGGSPFQGSSATFGLLHRTYSHEVIVQGDTIHPALMNLMADFFIRSSSIEFFKVLTIRGSVLLPLEKEGTVTSRITIAIPVGKLEVFN